MTRQEGTALLEALLAGLLFSAAVGGAAATAMYHERALRVYQDRNTAAFLAEQELEEILAHTFTDLPQAVAAYPRELKVRRTVDSSVLERAFVCQAVVQESAGGELRTVRVEVSYQEDGGTREVSLETDVFWTH